MITFEREKRMDPSGIRLGTPALTTRGLKEEELRTVGGLIAKVLKNLDDEMVKNEVRGVVKELTGRFPIYERM